MNEYERNEVTRECRKLYNEEINDLYFSPNIVRAIQSRRMRWEGHVVRMGEKRGVYRALVGKPEGKRSLGRPTRIWEVNIKMIFRKWDVGVWNGSRWLRIGNRLASQEGLCFIDYAYIYIYIYICVCACVHECARVGTSGRAIQEVVLQPLAC
jgi:hypothetical protein